MKKFYTFVDSKTDRNSGTNIFHRFFDGTQRRQEITNQFPIDLYVKAEYGTDSDIYGNKLKGYQFHNTKEAEDFIARKKKESTDVYGQQNFIYQFITKTYPDKIVYDINHIVVANFDIETESNNGFPLPSLANQVITAITIKSFGESNSFVSFGTKEYNTTGSDIYIRGNNEKDMLIKFLEYWDQLRPDFITGFNIEGFDIPYLVNRIRKVVSKKATYKLSPFHNDVDNPIKEIDVGFGDKGYEIFGLVTFDFQLLYKKFSTKKPENHKLDTIAKMELGQQKLEFDGYIKGKTFELLTGTDCVIIPDNKKIEEMPMFVRYVNVMRKLEQEISNRSI
ncbi:MAG: 3'-5' exonuclease [Bacteroidales bacterium]|jgi:DNA polymerase elongation subunit (family B)